MNPRESTEGKVVFLDRGEYTTCTVLLQGCSIISWRINNEEQLFVSRISPFSAYKNVQGGVRLIWPHHNAWSFGSQHGFVRDLVWNVVRGPEFLPNGDVFVDFAVSSDCSTKAMWNFDFQLQYRITLHPNQLSMVIIVKNPKKYFEYDFHIMLQCYLKVENIRDVQILGLKNCLYDDLLAETGLSLFREKNERIRLAENVDKLFRETPEVVRVQIGTKFVNITKNNLPDLKVWNPGETKAMEMDDFDGDEYKYFVALEGGYVYRKYPLRNISDFKISLSLEVESASEEKKEHPKNVYDYFDGYC